MRPTCRPLRQTERSRHRAERRARRPDRRCAAGADPAGRRAAAVRSVRGRPSDPADGGARLGRAPDPPSAGLRRAALHLRRPQPRRRRVRLAHRVDLLSWADPRARPGGPARAGLAKLVPLLPVGGLARRATQAAGARDPAAARTLDRRGRGCGGQARAAPAGRGQLRRAGVERGSGAAALRAALRGGAGAGSGRPRKPVADPVPGEPMRYDHRRILATGIARLRAKIKYRPGRVRADAARLHAAGSCSAPSRRWPGAACTSRISAAWSISRAWSRRPAP